MHGPIAPGGSFLGTSGLPRGWLQGTAILMRVAVGAAHRSLGSLVHF